MDEVREYMRNRNLPPELRRRVRIYLEDVYRQSSFNERDMLSQLPESLKKEVQERIYAALITEVPFFSADVIADDMDILTRLCSMFRPRIASKEEAIYQEGEIGHGTFWHGCYDCLPTRICRWTNLLCLCANQNFMSSSKGK